MSFRACFCGVSPVIAGYVAKWGIAQMCLCETKYQGGVSHQFWGAANLLEKISRDMGYHSDSIAVSRDMGSEMLVCPSKKEQENGTDSQKVRP